MVDTTSRRIIGRMTRAEGTHLLILFTQSPPSSSPLTKPGSPSNLSSSTMVPLRPNSQLEVVTILSIQPPLMFSVWRHLVVHLSTDP
jgi:hypothetical protein